MNWHEKLKAYEQEVYSDTIWEITLRDGWTVAVEIESIRYPLQSTFIVKTAPHWLSESQLELEIAPDWFSEPQIELWQWVETASDWLSEPHNYDSGWRLHLFGWVNHRQLWQWLETASDWLSEPQIELWLWVETAPDLLSEPQIELWQWVETASDWLSEPQTELWQWISKWMLPFGWKKGSGGREVFTL